MYTSHKQCCAILNSCWWLCRCLCLFFFQHSPHHSHVVSCVCQVDLLFGQHMIFYILFHQFLYTEFCKLHWSGLFLQFSALVLWIQFRPTDIIGFICNICIWFVCLMFIDWISLHFIFELCFHNINAIISNRFFNKLASNMKCVWTEFASPACIDENIRKMEIFFISTCWPIGRYNDRFKWPAKSSTFVLKHLLNDIIIFAHLSNYNKCFCIFFLLPFHLYI